jgi:hypothetical protein
MKQADLPCAPNVISIILNQLPSEQRQCQLQHVTAFIFMPHVAPDATAILQHRVSDCSDLDVRVLDAQAKRHSGMPAIARRQRVSVSGIAGFVS